MVEDRTPKVFISYSWSSEELVLQLANRLISHGVDVVLDKWSLKEGRDKYSFMEQCVNNPDISKVLIICDKSYVEKANNRAGGVGDETLIISSEVYGNANQEKFIPIIAERNDDGSPCVPTYISNRIYIDFSYPDKFEAEYEKLIRNIWNKPQYVKPALGKRPEWLDEEKENLFPTRDLIRQIRGSNTDSKLQSCIRRFQNAYLELLKEYFEAGASPERIYEIYLNTKPARDVFLDYVEALADTDSNYAETLSDCFESMYNQLVCIRTFQPNTSSASEADLDVFKILIWELFICTIAFMRYIKDYASIHIVLTHTYFLETNIFGGKLEPNDYTAFRHHSQVVEDYYKPQTSKKQFHTLLGDTICSQREKVPIYTSEAIAEADLFLYQIYNALGLDNEKQSFYPTYWFPTLYVYVKRQPKEWQRMKSRKYCEKMMVLFGVDNISDLKKAVNKCKLDDKMRYSGTWQIAPTILSCVKIEDIGTLN